MTTLIVIIAVEAAAILVLFATLRSTTAHLRDAQQQRDLAQQEVRVLTDAIARANRTPVIRVEEKPRQLERSDAYWEPRTEIKVTAS